MTNDTTALRQNSLAGTQNDTSERAATALAERPPEDCELKVVQDSEEVIYLHIPAAPPEGDIDDAELLRAEGGTLGLVLSTQVCGYVATGFAISVIEP